MSEANEGTPSLCAAEFRSVAEAYHKSGLHFLSDMFSRAAYEIDRLTRELQSAKAAQERAEGERDEKRREAAMLLYERDVARTERRVAVEQQARLQNLLDLAQQALEAECKRATAAEQRAAELEGDAELWRAIVKCSRVRLLGYARGGPQGGEGPIRHIGLELWTDHPDFPDREAINAENARTLTEFAEAARALLTPKS